MKREPFGEILERTLKRFLESQFGESFNVKWHSGIILKEQYSNNQLWFCNPYLNAIFISSIIKQNLLPLINEFSRSLVWWRRPFQKMYVGLATTRRIYRWFARATVEISPPLKNAENLLILGGNHHLRLLDYNKGKSFVIHKAGFNRAFITNDIRVRRENPYLPTPAMRDVAEDGSWYSEELVAGTPINRLKDIEQSKRAAKDVMAVLLQLYKKTARKVKTIEYALEIIKRIEKRIKTYSCFANGIRKNILEELLALRKIVNCLQDEEVIVAQTHGDFQSANILVDGNLTWLIDWEYTAERQIAYDALVFALKARFLQGLKQRILQAIKDDFQGCEQLLELIPDIQRHNIDKRRSMLMLFLLEDMELKVIEACNSVFFGLDQGFTRFWKEAQRTIQTMAGMC